MEQIISKSLPSAVKLEETIIGAMLVDTRSPDVVMQIIKTPEAFHDLRYRAIFNAISEMYIKGEAIDLLTVSHKLKQMNSLEMVGGDFALISIVQKIASGAHVEDHARIIMQQYLRRKIIMFSGAIIGLAGDDSKDVFELISKWQSAFDKVADLVSNGRSSVSFPQALDHLKREIEHLSNITDQDELVGIDTGFAITNKYTGGYRSQDLVILAARPGMGKTSKVMKTAVANIRKGVPVGFISLEMSVHQLTARAVAIDSDLHLNMLLKIGFKKKKYFEAYENHQERMKNYPFYLDDSGSGDVADVVMIAKQWKRMHGIELLIIDYLQLMGNRASKGNRENEISSISRRLKMLAKELEIPIIVLSQLSRAVETRGGSKRPVPSDLRESGAIEQDADIIEFIYRPEHYGKEFRINADDYEQQRHKDLIALGADTEIIFAKYRGGAVGTTMLQWVGDKTRFKDVDDPLDVVEYIDAPNRNIG